VFQIAGEEVMDVETRIKLDQLQLRDYQLPIQDAIENKGYKRCVAILPRRARQGDHVSILGY
jgi:hypothetical protein